MTVAYHTLNGKKRQ